ncbi:GNAT family N-acetyltransferase [Isoptericola sp. NPDC057559]|uniref:GNAT family N-acetyltransferase n=1 Tax=Isoptericola sp. NPDC057559 TaxID=3346168 RepID=UPI0036D032D9
MLISRATTADVVDLAQLLYVDTAGEVGDDEAVDEFAAELGRWWAHRGDSHAAFVARSTDGEVVGMAWVAFVPRVPRVPRPRATGRLSADIQTVFVRSDHRGRGLGTALVEAAAEHATRHGAAHVTVHSSRRAVPVDERLGFASSPQLLRTTAPRT